MLTEKKLYPEEYRSFHSSFRNFKNRQNKSMVLEVRTVRKSIVIERHERVL